MSAFTSLTGFTWPTPTPTPTRCAHVTSSTLVTSTRPVRSVSETPEPHNDSCPDTRLSQGLLGGFLGFAVLIIVFIIYTLRRKGMLRALKPDCLGRGASESTISRWELASRSDTSSEDAVIQRSLRTPGVPQSWADVNRRQTINRVRRMFSTTATAGTAETTQDATTPESGMSDLELGINVTSPETAHRASPMQNSPQNPHMYTTFQNRVSRNSATMHPVPWPLRPGSGIQSPQNISHVNQDVRISLDPSELWFNPPDLEQSANSTPLTVLARVIVPDAQRIHVPPPSLRRMNRLSSLRARYGA